MARLAPWMPGQKRDVGDLLRGLIFLQLLQQSFVGEDQAVDEHARLVALGNAPAAGIDLLERCREKCLSPWSVLRSHIQISTITSASQPSARLLDFQAVVSNRLDLMPKLMPSAIERLAEDFAFDAVRTHMDVEARKEQMLGIEQIQQRFEPVEQEIFPVGPGDLDHARRFRFNGGRVFDNGGEQRRRGVDEKQIQSRGANADAEIGRMIKKFVHAVPSDLANSGHRIGGQGSALECAGMPFWGTAALS